MIYSYSNQELDDFKPDLTPLLDIIFIVMVFLLLTSNIAINTLKVDVPETEESAVLQDIESEVIVINILAKQGWAVEGEKIKDWQGVKKALLEQHQLSPNKELVISADKKAPIDKMMKLLAFLQQNKIKTTSVTMDEE
ncbi:biopolymer transporter ExbD [Vibrio sp. SS-MA-C1-2]|uniref:ExbD/TolR family protein n=1 Tax=Vibrio sp. SS-MA-C1-2 TaxID=2908646 RepID=UPI001F47460E|nr:biopolymer transporter ExbD [Vibrio sp. SS-MA-C1-2]UJF17333.1 biopolymer transporter ExbD [Vibrio sp. SS-MA-C1-2]